MNDEHRILYHRIGRLTSNSENENWFEKEPPLSAVEARKALYSLPSVDLLSRFVTMFFHDEIQMTGLTYLLGANLEVNGKAVIFDEKPLCLLSKITCLIHTFRPGVARLDGISMIFDENLDTRTSNLMAYEHKSCDSLNVFTHAVSNSCVGQVVVLELPDSTVVNLNYRR